MHPSLTSQSDFSDMSSKVAVNGIELAYVVTGEGPTVVQVHNAGWGKATFERVTPLLAVVPTDPVDRGRAL
jgi:hypothetical protein